MYVLVCEDKIWNWVFKFCTCFLKTQNVLRDFSSTEIMSLVLMSIRLLKTRKWVKCTEGSLAIIQNEVKDEKLHEQNPFRLTALKQTKKMIQEYFGIYLSNCITKLTQGKSKKRGESTLSEVSSLRAHKAQVLPLKQAFGSQPAPCSGHTSAHSENTDTGWRWEKLHEEATACARCLFNYNTTSILSVKIEDPIPRTSTGKNLN